MSPGPIRVVHLFSETVNGFIARLWVYQLLHLEADEFQLALVLPDRTLLGEQGLEICSQRGIEIHELAALSHLRNPVYALRSRLSLYSRCQPNRTDILHTHFPEAALLTGLVRRRLGKTGLVHSLYRFAGEWKLDRPSRLSLWGLRRVARHAERILGHTPAEEQRLLDLEIGKKYQLARIPLAIPTLRPTSATRETMAESFSLPVNDEWIGIFLPSLGTRQTRALLMNLVPLNDIVSGYQFVCVVPAGRLSETRTLALRLRMSSRFHFVADLNRWDELASQFRAAVMPVTGLLSAAAAQIALSAACPTWIRADCPWLDLLPPAEQNVLCRGQSYRLKEEVESLLGQEKQVVRRDLAGETLADYQAEQVAARLRGLYLDILAEKGSGLP